MNDEEQGSPRDQPRRNLRNGLEVFHHGTLHLPVELPCPIELRCPLAILPCPASLREHWFQGFLFTRGWRWCLCQLDGRGRDCKWNGYTNCCRWLGRGFRYLLRLRQYFLLALARRFHLLRLCPYFLRALARGGVTPEASRNSSKLNFRNASKRRRSGAACTSPLNPK